MRAQLAAAKGEVRSSFGHLTGRYLTWPQEPRLDGADLLDVVCKPVSRYTEMVDILFSAHCLLSDLRILPGTARPVLKHKFPSENVWTTKYYRVDPAGVSEQQ